MEREEIEVLLQDEAVAAVLAEKFVSKTDFDKVNNKKEQLLSEKKREQDKVKQAQEQLSKWQSFSEQVGKLGFDVEDIIPKFLESLQKQHDGTPEGSPDPQKNEAVKILEDRMTIQKQTFEKQIESIKKDYEKKLAEMQAENSRILQGWDGEKIENTLLSEMNRVGVLPIHQKTIKMAFKTRAEVSENEDGVRGVLLTNDNGLKISATEFFDSFAQSDEGKAYIAAPQSSGGGAVGGKGGRQSIDFNAERNKALQRGDARSSVELAMAQFRSKTR